MAERRNGPRSVPRYACGTVTVPWLVPSRAAWPVRMVSGVVVAEAAEQASNGLGADFGAELFGEGGGELPDGGAGARTGGLDRLAEVGRLRSAAGFASAGAAGSGEG